PSPSSDPPVTPDATREPPKPSSEQLAQRAKEILEKACYRCHGKEGSVEGGFNYVLDLPQLVARRKMIVPGKPEESLIFQRTESGEMPPADACRRLSHDQVALLRQWIQEGARDFNPSVGNRPFLGDLDVLEFIRDDLEKAAEEDRRFLRYFTITHLYNAGLP